MEIDQTELREYLADRDYKLQIHMKAAKLVVDLMLMKDKKAHGPEGGEHEKENYSHKESREESGRSSSESKDSHEDSSQAQDKIVLS